MSKSSSHSLLYISFLCSRIPSNFCPTIGAARVWRTRECGAPVLLEIINSHLPGRTIPLRCTRVPINIIGYHVRSVHTIRRVRACRDGARRNKKSRADLIDGISPRLSPATHRTMSAVAVGLASTAEKEYIADADDINDRY